MMELKDLIGEHILTGVDMSTESIEQYDGYFDNCEVLNFVLDGITYTAVEDPEDGYRSSMKKLLVSNKPVSNMFPAQKVLGMMEPKNPNDVLNLIDLQTGKVVVAVGTADTDDYYPTFVAEFIPENMAINQQPHKTD